MEINLNVNENPEVAARLCSKIDFCGAIAQDEKGAICKYERLHFQSFNFQSTKWNTVIPLNLALATKSKTGGKNSSKYKLWYFHIQNFNISVFNIL